MAATTTDARRDAARDAAHDAWTRGQLAIAAGDRADARRWLDRAHRLAPKDDTLALTLGTMLLGHDDARAAALLSGVAERHSTREAWLALAAARLACGDAPGAAQAMTRLLSRFALMPDTVPLARAIAAATGAPGWCGLSGTGTITAEAGAALSITLDGAPAGLAERQLPAGWDRAHAVRLTEGGVDLLGSPIRPRAIVRLEGFVCVEDGEAHGWAWHPGDPERDPVLTVEANGRRRTLRATAPLEDSHFHAPLARPRRFSLSAVDCPVPAWVRGPDGRGLPGSPVDPGADQRHATQAALAAARRNSARPQSRAEPLARTDARPWAGGPAASTGPSPPVGCDPRARPVAVVIPVHDGGQVVLDCLASVLATVPRGTRVIVVDDASADPALVAALDGHARARRVALIRHPANLGFPAAANAGMRAAGSRDVVLLNSDTLVPPLWLEHLRDAARASPDIGTASPLSNDATILSYPRASESNPAPDSAGTAALSALARHANGGTIVDVPTTVGFCMYIRRDCLDATGLFDETVFAQGYGEENDFCIRARHLGWRHVAAAGVFVAHRGGASFGAARTYLPARNMRVLNRLHPGYDALIAGWAAADPLAPARRAIDLRRFRAARRRGARSAILVTHDCGGGVERVVAARCDALRAAGLRPIVLRAPDPEAVEQDRAVTVSDGTARDFPNLRFEPVAGIAALVRLLRAEAPESVEFHHMLGHDPSLLDLPARLGVPHDVHVHDYAWFCPRISLVGRDRRYCGEPALDGCEACIADTGSLLDDGQPVALLRARSAAMFAAARRITAPSNDAARRIRRQFPGCAPAVSPPEDDAALDPPSPAPSPMSSPMSSHTSSGRVRVCAAGAIGLEKGIEILVACARDAARRDLPLEFVVVGHTTDDTRLLDTGRVFVTGEYRPDEAVTLIRQQHAQFGFVCSVAPETWCFTLSELWQAGLPVACFDLGAQAEQVRATGRGIVLPNGADAARVNDALLRAASATQPFIFSMASTTTSRPSAKRDA